MKTKSFYNLEQAQSYLNGSIIRLDGKPIFVNSVSRGRTGLKIGYCYISNPDSSETVLLNSDRINFNPVPLGLVNWRFPRNRVPEGVCYLSRIPRRGWKIGLHSSNFNLKNISQTGNPTRSGLMLTKSLENTILNKYPSLQEVRAIMLAPRPEKGVVAISRHFYVTTGAQLGYKMHGVVGEFEDIPKLGPEYLFLEELLDKELNCADQRDAA